MQKTALDRINERVNILNQMNQIESKQIKLELTYVAIENDYAQTDNAADYKYHDALQDIELKMSIFEEQYNYLQRKLTNLGRR
ncbi:MAG: hypothetical protein L3J43_02480 [Sulfurovum sp.]|nr:hypothetical protein [Sulfurovum sp.]